MALIKSKSVSENNQTLEQAKAKVLEERNRIASQTKVLREKLEEINKMFEKRFETEEIDSFELEDILKSAEQVDYDNLNRQRRAIEQALKKPYYTDKQYCKAVEVYLDLYKIEPLKVYDELTSQLKAAEEAKKNAEDAYEIARQERENYKYSLYEEMVEVVGNMSCIEITCHDDLNNGFNNVKRKVISGQ